MLQIDSNWRIRPDSMCWILEKKQVNQESFEANWQIKGYYQFLEDALYGACNHMMKSTKDIADLMTAIDGLHKVIRTACADVKPESEEIDFLD